MRQLISPSACDLIAAWCGQVAWSVRVLWFALLARHMDPERCHISSCMQACVHQSFFVRAHCSVARTSVLVCAIALVGFARSAYGYIGLSRQLLHTSACVSPSVCALIAACCGPVASSVRLLWFALLACHVDSLGCSVCSCLRACVRGSVHVLLIDVVCEAALHLTANGEHRKTNHH